MVERILSSVCRIFLFSAIAFPFLRIAGRLEYCYLYILCCESDLLFIGLFSLPRVMRCFILIDISYAVALVRLTSPSSAVYSSLGYV